MNDIETMRRELTRQNEFINSLDRSHPLAGEQSARTLARIAELESGDPSREQ